MSVPESAELRWWWNDDREELNASSLYHDGGSPLVYRVSESKDNFWQATFEGSTLCCGTLEQCLRECAEHELDAMREIDAEDDENRPERQFLRRLLNPEDLGRAVPAHVRDDAREVLGMARVES